MMLLWSIFNLRSLKLVVKLCSLFICLGTDGIETASFAARLLAVNAVARDLLPGYSKPLLSDALLDRLTVAVSWIWFLW